MSSKRNLAIVLVSGGMDSAVVAAIAKKEDQDLAFLHLNYGQKTKNKEKTCFDKISDFYKIPAGLRKVVDMTFLNQIGGSSLTDSEINVSKFEGDSDIIPTSYVPFRNTHIVALAVSWAEIIGATKIYIGANEEDSPGYPDCREVYYEAYNKLISLGTKEGNIQVVTPVIKLKKAQIIEIANDLSAPLEMTWSCYEREDRACGICDSCALRLRAFKELNQVDPIEYTK
jgi:7-cyano-7-deazaguanine synthase